MSLFWDASNDTRVIRLSMFGMRLLAFLLGVVSCVYGIRATHRGYLDKAELLTATGVTLILAGMLRKRPKKPEGSE